MAPMVLSYYCDMTLSQEFYPMEAQLSLKAALPMTERLATAEDRCSKTGPWILANIVSGNGLKLPLSMT